jgi:hypothetical protein
MIAPRIDTHINRCRHVAAHALRLLAFKGLMEVMLGRIIGRWCMTSGADAIAFSFQLLAVRVVAIAAAHPALGHFALHK